MKCPICKFDLESPDSLTRHIEKAHKNSKKQQEQEVKDDGKIIDLDSRTGDIKPSSGWRKV